MNKISAKIVADSMSPQGHRITSYILTYPRFIHAEVMTHRMFTRNAASSRAIPFDRMIEMVKTDPFIPIAWQKDHKGMQGVEYFEDEEQIEYRRKAWILAAKEAAFIANTMNKSLLATKQLCNRLLEPFLWHTCLVTATEYDNFFELRCPQYTAGVPGEGYKAKSWKELLNWHSNERNLEKLDEFSILDRIKSSESPAEIHIQALAEAMWDAKNESIPANLPAGKWHIPFGDKIEDLPVMKAMGIPDDLNITDEELDYLHVKVATARCARLSYMTFDGDIDYEKDCDLHDMLLKSKHMSPFEHCARTMSDEEYETFIKGVLIDGPFGGDMAKDNSKGWCDNFRGFISYRHLLEEQYYDNRD